MATRRTHHKSRLGCQQCKKRRIKCDVTYPRCINCEKRNSTCSFLLLAPSSSLSLIARASSTMSIPTSQSSLSPLPSAASAAPAETSSFAYKSPRSLIQSSVAAALTPILYRPLGIPHEEPVLDFISTISPPQFELVQSTQLHHAHSHRFDNTWKDIRDTLPRTLHSVLEHYEYLTSLTLATDKLAQAAWQRYIPELAHRHDFLVNCVLSVSSLHLSRLFEDATDKQRMYTIAAACMNKALVTYRPQLEKINQNNAAALFASATLTAVYFFRTSAIDIENLHASIPLHPDVPPTATIEQMMACVLRTIWGLRGPTTVLMNGWRWVIEGKLNPIAARRQWPKERIPATRRAIMEHERLKAIERLWQYDQKSDDEDAKSRSTHLSQALSFLCETYALISQLTLPKPFLPMMAVPYAVDDMTVLVLVDRGAIFLWATLISREFIRLAEKKDTAALVILAHYAVIPGRVRNVWWLEGVGADIITAVAMALGREKCALITWPANALGVDLEKLVGFRRDGLEGTPHEMHIQVT